ncbi:fibronectin type III domain-containing protein [Flavobacterium cutihirudinis]|nr:fibronectin type III domain-containing protein [Flavobacterium cutihirudinis]
MKKSLLIAIISCLPFFLNAQTTTTFTLAGTQTFVTPAGITTLNVQAWGAGGAGGASTNPGLNGARGGSGGGGGAFASAAITVTSGTTLSVVVGAGGKGAVGATVFSGGFSGITGFPISAEGGRGGLQNTNNTPAGGLGGSVAGSTGTTIMPGAPGESGQSGFTEEDENGQPVIVRAGAGGNAANGGGTGGARLNTPFASSVGNNGNAPGGGGSGGRSSFLFPARKGGDGGDGKVIIGYTCPTYTADSATGSNVNVCSGTSSEITLTGTLPVGLYSVSYEIQGIAQTPAAMQVTTAGTGTFIATGFTTVGTVYVKITALTSGSSTVASENCTSQLPVPLLVPVVVNSSGTAPVATAGTGATCNQITANWQAVAGAVYYELDVSTVNTFASFVTGYSALNVGNVLTYNITGLANATYYYRVRAYNGNCISANSNTITYATAVIPGTVTSMTGTAGICTEFIARWNTLTSATSYLLDVSTTSTFNAGTFVAGYNALDVGNVTNYDVTGLNPNTQYYYRLKGKSGCGISVNYSAVQTVTTTNAIPGTVTSLTANSIFCNSFNARWNSSSATTSYLLDVSTSSTFASFLPGYQSLDVDNVNGYVVTGLTGGTQYYYRVKAKNGCGVSANYSTVQSPITSTAAPGTPTVTISSALCNQISISWTTPTGSLSYTVQMSTSNTFPIGSTTQTITGLTTNNYTFTGLPSGQTYYVRVYAKNGCSVGDGTVSSIVTTGTISPAAAPTVTANGSLTICQTDGVRLTSSAAPTGYGYLWSTGSTSNSIFVTAPGSYTVQFSRAGGCNSPASVAQVVVVENLPTASAGGSQTICSNQSATVSGASASNGSIQWTFSGGAGTLANSTSLTPTYTPALGGPARTVVLTMTVTSTNSCMPQIATAKYTINIQAAPTVSISGAKSTCPGGAITVLAGEANATNGTILWGHDGSGTIANGTTLTPTYTSVAADAGKQVTLTMTVTASPACSTTYAVSDVYPVVVFANNTVGAASSSPVVCINTPITDVTHVTDGALGIGTPVDLPAGVTATWATNTIIISGTPTEAGIFNYSIPLTGGCGTLNATGTITVNALTASPTIGTVELPTCVNSQGKVELTGLPSGNWSIAQSGTVSQTYSSSGSNYTISGLIPGNYSFTVQVGSNCPSLPTLNVIIDAPVTNVWNGTVWSTGSPPIDTDAIEFNGDFVSTSDLEGCSCKVNDGRNVTINSGNTLKIKHGLTVNSGAGAILTFENNASLVQEDDNAVNTGNINYKRTTTPVRRYDFTHWGCPVTRTPAFTLHDLSPNTLADKYYKYDPNNGWVIIYNGTDAWIKGVGYIIRSPQNYDIDVPAVFNGTFNGVPNNGLVTVPISTAAKWYLVGNPYPSAVYADQFIVDNQNVLYGTLYYWTHNSSPRKMAPEDTTYKYTSDDYAIYNLSGSVLAGTLTGEEAESPGSNTYAPIGYIASGQSIFVESKTVGDAFFNNAMRVVGNNDHFFKQDPKFKKLAEREKHRIWLNLRNTEGAFKQLLVAYVEGATNSWDDNFDTKTMDSNKYIDFYSNNESLNYSIQGKALPFNETELIPLGYKSTIAGEFSISIDHVDGLFNTQNIYLEDKKNNVVHNLRESNYKFSTETGTFNDRFVLRYTGKTLGTDDITNLLNYVLCTVKDKIVRVKSSKETLKDVYIFDVSGKMLYKKNKIGETELQISNLQSANQVLMIRVVLDDGSSQTQKVIF